MKYVLISGSFKNMEMDEEIVEFIRKNCVDKIIVSFVAATFDTYAANDNFINKLINLFDKKGLIFDQVYVIDERINNKQMLKNIHDSNIVFLLGGDTLSQIDYINKYKLKKEIKNKEKIIVGMSAGAINMAENVVLAKDEEDNIPQLSIYKGLGITTINIEPHCDFKNKKHWKDIEEASYYSDIVVMNDDCYIIGDNENIHYYGSYLILSKAVINYKGKLCTLDYFLEDINYD